MSPKIVLDPRLQNTKHNYSHQQTCEALCKIHEIENVSSPVKHCVEKFLFVAFLPHKLNPRDVIQLPRGARLDVHVITNVYLQDIIRQ